MTRKLVVPVLAISLAVFGCGSDSTGKKDAAAKLDVAPASVDTGAGSDVPATPADAAKKDVATKLDGVVVPVDGAKLDVVKLDVAAIVDGGAGHDVAPIDRPITPDAGPDAPAPTPDTAVDTGPAPGIDSGADADNIDA